jgi:surfeit locus 1 family protein
MPKQRAGLLWPFAFTILACAILAFLGFWQMQRLAWKEGLITQIETRAKSPPVPSPEAAEWPELLPKSYEYRHIVLTGIFDHDKETLVFWPSGRGTAGTRQPGFLVLTPLRLESGAYVIINRGFVPQELANSGLWRAGRVEGKIRVTGLMRAPEPRSIFTPRDDPAHGHFFSRDPAPIAARLGPVNVAPFLVDADDGPVPGGWPKGGTTELALRNNHLAYAMTWFGLALVCLGTFCAYAWQWRKGDPSASMRRHPFPCL